jgi:hypothetical protein
MPTKAMPFGLYNKYFNLYLSHRSGTVVLENNQESDSLATGFDCGRDGTPRSVTETRKLEMNDQFPTYDLTKHSI